MTNSPRALSRLSGLHRALLALHKSLLEVERKQYEAVYGRIPNPHEYLKIVMSHPSFDWLRTLSGLIVSIDEFESAKEPTGGKTEEELIATVTTLTALNEQADAFARKYYNAFQSSPDVAHAHGEVMQALKKLG